MEDEKEYVLREKKRRSFAKNLASETIYDVKLGKRFREEELVKILPKMKKTFDNIVNDIMPVDIVDTDLVRLYITHPDLNVPITIAPTQAQKFTAQDILDKLEYVMSSNKSLKVDEAFEFHLAVIRVPVGSGRSKILAVSQLADKQSIVQIRNHDHLCLARAIVVADAKQENHPKYHDIKRAASPWQTYYAKQLQNVSGFQGNGGVAITDIPLFEKAIQKQIVVFSSTRGNKPIHVGVPQEKRLYLWHTERGTEEAPDGHYDTINSITGALGVSYFCPECLIGYNDRKQHKCSAVCNICRTIACSDITSTNITCMDCNRSCRSRECLDRHKSVPKDRTGKRNKSMCETFVQCTKCRVVLDRSKRTLDQHICGEYYCQNCDIWVTDNSNDCSTVYTSDITLGHRCYMRALEPKDIYLRHIYLDFETEQTRGEHNPIFVVAQTVCDMCMTESCTKESKCVSCGSRCDKCSQMTKDKTFKKSPCDTCGYRRIIFEGLDTLQTFGAWLFSPQHRDATVLSHNGRAFDTLFLLHYLIYDNTQKRILPNIIYSGSKIMCMTIQEYNMRIIDSLSFFPMRLSKLPKSFGLTELAKGYFPHYFLTQEHMNYIGPYPAMSDYGFEYMSTEDYETFIGWYAKVKDGVFDLREEIERYCVSDVDILHQACIKFRQQMLDITMGEGVGVDPFNYVTIASCCLAVHRTLYLHETWDILYADEQAKAIFENRKPLWEKGLLKKGELLVNHDGELVSYIEKGTIVEKKFVKSTLPIVPPLGYRTDTYSNKAIKHILWLAEKSRREGNPLNIQHALNGGEKTIIRQDQKGFYKVDGFYVDPLTGQETVIEWNGCFYHYCSQCNDHSENSHLIHPLTGEPMLNVFLRTKEKEKNLQNLGYVVISIWEHTYDMALITDMQMKQYIESLNIETPLVPRECLYGGHTEPFRMHCTVKPTEQIHYVDFTSLYPSVQATCKYPTCHPTVILRDFKPLDQYWGLCKVTVLPPRGLYVPVLPVRAHGKLIFGLCQTCIDNQSSECTCCDAQRMIKGTWVIEEVLLALRRGYRLVKIYEIYHFEETTDTIFKPYVNKFLQLKQQCSGVPDWVKSDKDMNKYIDDYYHHEGILLEKDEIQDNPGMRSLCKLMLNSLWGRYTMRENMPQSKLIDGGEYLFKLLGDESRVLKGIHILSEDYAQIEWENNTDYQRSNTGTSIYVGIFTTAYGRMRLYDLLNSLDRRLLYADTDSAIFTQRPDQYAPPLGDYLGQLTSELTCKATGCKDKKCQKTHHIVDFCSGGPKQYAYLTDTGFTQTKLRGFSLNHTASKKLNYHTLKELVLKNPKGVIETVQPKKICRNKYTIKIYNREEIKRYRLKFEKRYLTDALDSFPYGY